MEKIIKEIGYKNIQLVPLELKYLHEILDMRNSEIIRQNMFYQKTITFEEHYIWFEKVNKSGKDFYWVIVYEGITIGLVNVKEVDWERLEGESGLFIGNKEYHTSFISFIVYLLLLDYAFYKLGLQQIRIKVLRSNVRALKFNRMYGFKFINNDNNIAISEQANDIGYSGYLDIKDYKPFRDNLIKILRLDMS